MSIETEDINNQEQSNDRPPEIVFEEPQNALVPLTPEQRARRDTNQMHADAQDDAAARAAVEEAFAGSKGKNQELEPNLDSSNFYDRLGVSDNASNEQIAKAYRDLAKQFHPDRNPGNKEAEARFKAVTEAFEVLNNDEKRKEYDAAKRAVEDLAYSLTRDAGTEIVPVANRDNLSIMIRDEIRGSLGDQLPAVIEKFQERGALTKFIYEVETQSGTLESLTGDIKKDTEKIEKFFDGYGLPFSEPVLQRMGESLYNGAVEAKKKGQRGLLGFFLLLVQGFSEDVARNIKRNY